MAKLLRSMRLPALALLCLCAAIAGAQHQPPPFPTTTLPTNLLRATNMVNETMALTVSDTHLYIGLRNGTVTKHTREGAWVKAVNTWTDSTGSGVFTDGAMVGFSPITRDGVFYFCSAQFPAIYRYNTADDTIVRLAGNGVGGHTDSTQTGTNARFTCGALQRTTALSNDQDAVFYARGIVNKISVSATMAADSATVEYVLGAANTTQHADGVGAAARLREVTSMVYHVDKAASTHYLIVVGPDTDGAVRYISLNQSSIATSTIRYGADVNGTDAAGRISDPRGLARARGTVAFGSDGDSLFTLSWKPDLSSFHVEHTPTIAGADLRGSQITPDGRVIMYGTAAGGQVRAYENPLHNDTMTTTTMTTTTLSPLSTTAVPLNQTTTTTVHPLSTTGGSAVPTTVSPNATTSTTATTASPPINAAPGAGSLLSAAVLGAACLLAAL